MADSWTEASITPATSVPGTEGSFGVTAYRFWRINVSEKLTPATWTRTST